MHPFFVAWKEYAPIISNVFSFISSLSLLGIGWKVLKQKILHIHTECDKCAPEKVKDA